MSDAGVGELVLKEFVPVYEQVGQFVSTTYRSKYRDKEWESVSKAGGNVVTYFCTPQQEVLGWVVGPASAEQLIAAAEQARDAFEQIADDTERDEDQRRQRIRDHFLDELHPANRLSMRVWSNDSRDVARASGSDVTRILSLAKQTSARTLIPLHQRNRALIEAGRFRNPVVRAESARIDQMIRDDEPQMVLAELPLISLEQIRRPIFERLARQRFEPRTKANDKLLAAVQASIAKNQPTLLILGGDYLKLPYDLPPNPELEALSRQFGIHKLTSKDLTRLADDLNQPPVESTHGLMRYVILNGAGERTAVIILLRNSIRSPYRSILSDEPEKAHRGGATLLLAEMKQSLATRHVNEPESTASASDGSR